MPDRRDREYELDMVRRVTVVEEHFEAHEKRIKVMEDRWEKQDSHVLRWLIRAIIILGMGTLTGSSDTIRKKLLAWLPWLG